MGSFDEIKDASMDDMREETTELALIHINSNRDIYNLFVGLKYTEMERHAEAIAKRNKDEFGELFVAELPLVKWKKIRSML